VVIAIIGLLSTLAIVALGSAREKSRDSKRLADLRQIQAALELHYADNNTYPIVTEPVQLGTNNSSCLNADGFVESNCINAYMPLVPRDPSDFSYVYSSNDGTTYTIQARIEGQINNLAGQIIVTPSAIANTQ
jgi:type II secretory pathway pseudopilin PulG